VEQSWAVSVPFCRKSPKSIFTFPASFAIVLIEREQESASILFLSRAKPQVKTMSKKPTYDELQNRILELESAEIEKERSDLKLAKEALKESEQNLKRAQRISKLGNWYYDWDSKTEIWSDECFNLYGIKKEDYPNNVVPEILSKKIYSNFDEIQNLSSSLAKKNDTYELQFTTVPINGQVKIIHSYCEVERDNNGKILKVFGTDQDITERVEAEKRLKESHAELSVLSKRELQVNKILKKLALGGTLEEVLSMILEAAEEEFSGITASILLVDKDGKRLCSGVKSRLPDYLTKAIDGTPVKDEMGSCGTAAFRGETIITEDIQTHPHWKGVRELTKRAGLSACWSQPVIASNGKIVGTFALYNSKPKRATPFELELMETMAQVAAISIESHRIKLESIMVSKMLTNIIDSMPSVLIGVGIEGKITQWNLEAENFTGIPRDKAYGQRIEKVYPKIEDEIDELHKAILSKKVRKSVKKVIHQAGERYEDITIYPLRSHGMKGAVVRIDDVTERVRLEETMIQNEKMRSIGVLAGGIAHDFNNLLVGILGNLSLARHLLEKSNKASPLLQKAEKASLRAKNLTGQLLTFSKGGDPVRQTVALDSLIKEASKFMLAGSNVVCKYTLPEDLWLVDVDLGQISQVIQNLIINANEAMVAGGVIEVRCENITQHSPSAPQMLMGEKYVQVSISDDGPGIPESLLGNIFEPYFSTKLEGSGLGLAICHSIIGKHDGCITVQSKVGKGTSFVFYLPVAIHAEQKLSSSFESIHKKGSGKVMVMDDEKVVCEVATEMLTHLGYEVVIVSDGEEAIEMYKKLYSTPAPVDLIIMDLTIPNGIGGKEAVHEILAINEKANVIVSSGYSTDPVIANFKEFGFVDALKKPFDLNQLSKVINVFLT